MSPSWPQFQPETIAIALFNLLQQSTFTFETYYRKGALPLNVPAANQPYLSRPHRDRNVSG